MLTTQTEELAERWRDLTEEELAEDPELQALDDDEFAELVHELPEFVESVPPDVRAHFIHRGLHWHEHVAGERAHADMLAELEDMAARDSAQIIALLTEAIAVLTEIRDLLPTRNNRYGIPT